MSLTKFQNYTKIMIDQLQYIEDQCLEFKGIRSIEDSVGKQLDIAGEIVGESRQGKNDVEYRTAIRYRILLNKSNGEPEMVILGLKIFVPTATFVHYREVYPAKILLEFMSVEAPPTNLRQLLEQIASAGVKIGLSWIEEGLYFGFDDEGGIPAGPDVAGFGEDGYPEIGGKLVEEI